MTSEAPIVECNCVMRGDPGPTVICEEFVRDEDGFCFTCGHEEKCHAE